MAKIGISRVLALAWLVNRGRHFFVVEPNIAQPEPNTESSDAVLRLAFAALRENITDDARRQISELIGARVTATFQRDAPTQVD